MKRIFSVLSVGLASVVGPAGASSQQTLPVPLPRVLAELPYDFSSLVTVYERADGRLLLIDRVDLGLALADFGTMSVRSIGRRGEGPGEFRRLERLFGIGRDSALAPDTYLHRWMVVDRSGDVSLLSRDHSAVAAAGRYVLGADTIGNVLGSQVQRSDQQTALFDSISLSLTSRRSGDTRIVGRMRGERRRITVSLDAATKTMTQRVVTHPLAEREEAALFPDGWLAVARVQPFRVDWRRPDGTWIQGHPISYKSVAIGDTERRFVMRQIAEQQGREPADSRTLADWPESFPAFERDGLVPLADGRLLLRRPLLPGARTRTHFIVSRTGAAVAELQAPANADIIGAGQRGLYVRVVTSDGLLRLRRLAPIP
jgi:hypothetical protein